MRRAVAITLAVCCLFGGVVGAAGGGGFGPAQTGDVNPDTVSLTAGLQGDGDAVWTVEYRVRLDDDNTTAGFRSLQSDIRNNSTAYRDQFARRMRSTVAAAENATGREMGVRNVSVSTSIRQIPQRYGVVTYRFVWTGFADVDGDSLAAGDALSGFFLDAQSSLTITWPEKYHTTRVDPQPDETSENAVTWKGERDFGPGQPRVVVAPSGPFTGVPLLGVVAAVVLLGAGAGGAVLWRRRAGEDAEPTSEPAASAAGTGVDAAAGATTETADEGTEATGGNEDGDTTASDDADSTGGDEPPAELLSPEERVLKLLQERGGRMKQKEVTEALDWSAARTSQVVGGLRDDGEVESFRLGRENVLKLPDDEDDA